MMKKADVWSIVNSLKQLYPDSICSLQYEKDYELLFAVRLSAQCTDERVNKVTPALFARFPSLEAFAQADPEEVGAYIHSCGFFRAKSRDLVLCAQMLLRDYGGKVPDTHCIRIAGRLGLTDGTKDPAKVEQQLRKVLPPEESNNFCHRLVLHGRAVCTARTAKCGECPLTAWCRYAKTEFKKAAKQS